MLSGSGTTTSPDSIGRCHSLERDASRRKPGMIAVCRSLGQDGRLVVLPRWTETSGEGSEHRTRSIHPLDVANHCTYGQGDTVWRYSQGYTSDWQGLTSTTDRHEETWRTVRGTRRWCIGPESACCCSLEMEEYVELGVDELTRRKDGPNLDTCRLSSKNRCLTSPDANIDWLHIIIFSVI